jgi:RNA polymerase sigma-70 factor (ECF subfamily)
MTVATRVVLNDRRRIDPRGATLDPAGYVDPATAASERELGVALAKAIVELPEPQRIVLVLREYHDLDYDEIAQVLDLDLNTVKSRLSRARVAVREAMARSLPDLFRGAR